MSGKNETSVSLRKIKEYDLPLILRWRMMPEVTRYMYTAPVITYEDQQKWFARLQHDSTTAYWLITYENRPIGVLNLYDIDHVHSRCSWAYYIGEMGIRGKGIASILECNVYDFVFFNMKLNKLWCEVLSFNDKVVEIHKRFGSKVEGVLREHIVKNGKKYDVVRMSILKDEWLAIRDSYNYGAINIECRADEMYLNSPATSINYRGGGQNAHLETRIGVALPAGCLTLARKWQGKAA